MSHASDAIALDQHGAGPLRRFITHFLAPRLIAISRTRAPDFVVGGDREEGDYLRRWWLLPRNPVFNVYLHQFLRSDDDRALHDHMYVNLSVLLSGGYVEHTIRSGGVHMKTARRAGDVKTRLPWTAHRIELNQGVCWTLFVTGPRMRAWGFHCPDKGWVHWERFTGENPGQTGPGCEG
jgi:hypothetical protein